MRCRHSGKSWNGGAFAHSNGPVSPATNGALVMAKMHELAFLEISFRAADVVRIWPEWPATLAWNAAKERPWQPQPAIPKGTLKTLLAADYLPFAEVARMLAFGRGKTALGLSDIQEEAALLRAGLALIKAAAGGAVRFIGMPCERWPAAPHLLRQTGPRIPIEPEVLADLGPVPFGGRDWLGPRHFAEGYAECGHAPQSVRFCEAAIERTSLVRWLSALSTKAPGLSEAEVKNLILGEKAQDAAIGIGTIEQMVKAMDPLFPREAVRRLAREIGIAGKRGRRRKNSAG